MTDTVRTGQRGRPPLGEARKTERLTLHLTPYEKQLIETVATAVGEQTAPFARRVTLRIAREPTLLADLDSDYPALTRQLVSAWASCASGASLSTADAHLIIMLAKIVEVSDVSIEDSPILSTPDN